MIKKVIAIIIPVLVAYSIWLFILIIPKTVVGEVIFSDNFSHWTGADPYNFSTDKYVLPDGLGKNGWSHANGYTPETHNGVTHYGGEISTPGRGGETDRCFKVWRHGSFSYDYVSGMEYYRDTLFNAGKQIYVRWYMKISSDFQLAGGNCIMNYLKLWRFIVGSRSGCPLPNWCPQGAFEIYLNFNGPSFSRSTLQIGKSVNPGAGWKSLLATSLIRDSKWHCHEIRIKLNSTGKADAELEYWLDGVQKKLYQNLDWGAASGDYFSSAGFGIGNTGARDCSPQGQFQEPWKAIEFDDYVISTKYIGPVGDTTPPSPPAVLKIVQ